MPTTRPSSESADSRGNEAPRQSTAAETSKHPRARNPKWRSGALPTSPVDLAPTPRRLLAAARAVLERNGYEGLRLEAISQESGLAHSLIRYHFGSKDGLVGVLIDWMLYETYMKMHKGLTSLRPEDVKGRLSTLSLGLRTLFRDPLSYRLYFDLVVAALHDEDLRPKLADSFVGQRRLILEALETTSDSASRERADELSAIVVAFSDGLALQYLADPTGIDLDRVFAVWDDMMEYASRRPAPSGSAGSEAPSGSAGSECEGDAEDAHG